MDDIDSCGMRNLAEKIATGKLSVAAAADCASAFQKDGSTKAGAASRTVCDARSRILSCVWQVLQRMVLN